jgi:hypothetical protein
MTAYAIDYRADKLTVASDTLGYLPDRREVKPLGFICKVLHLPQIRAVMFGRGQQWITTQAVAALSISAQILAIEDAAEALPDILRKLTKQYAAAVGLAGDPGQLALLEITLAGWSEDQKRMRLWQFASYEGYTAHNEEDRNYGGPHPWPLLPADFLPREAPSVSLERRMIATIKAIDSYFVAEPEMSHGQRVGGEIALTEVTEFGISHRIVHRFDNYEQTRHAAAAVMGRLNREDIDGLQAVRDGTLSTSEAICSETGKPLTAAAPARLSRAERRQAERLARKSVHRAA